MKRISFCIGVLCLVNLLFAAYPGSPVGLSGSYDQTIKYWDLSTGNCIRILTGHTNKVNSVVISKDGRYALSGSNDKTMKYWKLSNGTVLRTFSEHNYEVTAVDISLNGKYAVSANYTTLKFWRLSDGVCLKTMSASDHNILSLSISPDGQYCLTGCPAIIDYWRLSDGTLLWTKTAHGGYVNSVDISPDGQYALSGGGNRDNTVKYWRLSDATCLRTMSSGSLDVTSVNFSFDGHYALSGTWALYNSGTIHYWRLSDGVCLISIDAGTYTSSVAFSADGLYCLAGSGSSLAYFRLSDGHSMFSMAGHSAEIKSVDTNGQETGFSYSNTSSAIPFTFTAAPSPFSNELRLTLPNKAVIYNLSGRRIVSFDKGVHSINTTLWQAGVYIIRCEREAKKIVKVE